MGRQITSIEPEFSLTAATADDMFALGMKYCIGHDVSQNLVAAHKWFNLAALKGSESAKQYRCEISAEMTAAEIADAQRQARVLLTIH